MKKLSLMGILLITLTLFTASFFLNSESEGPIDVEAIPPQGAALGEVVFVPNRGQTDPSVAYMAQGDGYWFFFTTTEIRMVFLQPPAASEPDPLSPDLLLLDSGTSVPGVALALAFENPNLNVQIVGVDPCSTTVNYLTGDTLTAGLPTYGQVTYQDLWPGIDLIFQAVDGTLKYTFHVAAGADPNLIEFTWQGTSSMTLNAAGDLEIATPLGTFTDTHPIAEQPESGSLVDVAFQLDPTDQTVGFALTGHDPNHGLVIDPGLDYSTFLGSSGMDLSWGGVGVDSDGNAYVAIRVVSVDYPVSFGAFDTELGGTLDIGVTKLSADLSTLVYSTYLGGSGGEAPFDLEVDSAGRAYVVGTTTSFDFPVTPGAFSTSLNNQSDAFLAVLNPTGTDLEYATYLGGSTYGPYTGGDTAYSVALGPSGDVYVVGRTPSWDFPTTPGAFDTTFNGLLADAFVSRMRPEGQGIADLVASTFIGGSNTEWSEEIVVSSDGSVVIAGETFSWNFPTTEGAFDRTMNGARDFYVARLTSDLSSLGFSTFLGGSGVETLNVGNHLAVGTDNSVFVAGFTASWNYPVTPAAYQPYRAGGDSGGWRWPMEAIVTRLAADGGSLLYSTYLGGALGSDYITGVSADAVGNAYLGGYTGSSDFPITANALDQTINGLADAFVAKLSGDGSHLMYSTFLGGATWDSIYSVELDAVGVVVMTGITISPDFPTTSGAFDTTFNGNYDVFVSRLSIPNTAPVAEPGGPYLAAVNDSIPFDGTRSEDLEGGPLTVAWDIEAGVVDDTSSLLPTYTAPTEAGVYRVDLTVTDEGGLSAVASTNVVVYDPTAGFVSGAGQIDSQSGAYILNPTATGKAVFAFVSRYQKGAFAPDGNTQFIFTAGNLRFHSESYEWLVVYQGGTIAQFKGVGIINGEVTAGGDAYRFMIWAKDNDPDTFRIRIWWEDTDGTEHNVYDNGYDGSGYEAGQPISVGNISVKTS
jgi:hypothetical protein